MSWPRRAVLLALPALAACGFTPVMAPGGAAGRLQNAVLVADPADRDAYLIVRRLEERLGRPGDPRYRLDTDITFVEERMAVTATNIATRFNVVGKVIWRLRDATTDAVLAEGRVDSFTGYSATGSTVATLAASRDARARLSTILADQLVTRLYAAAPTLP